MAVIQSLRVAILFLLTITIFIHCVTAQDATAPDNTNSSIASVASNGEAEAEAIQYTKFDPDYTAAYCWYPISVRLTTVRVLSQT